ncbi:glutamyl-tRNA reductase [Novispirillum itersonii]|uniref:Glutamyl-tRNA reductase n=1 Tax=Novispirillum itersonii TaxID=189 RepID=A0A7W9ZG33_NOVIT|nr:glutamyl-tRNA reductase [Novispirillum itersonii]MBB6209967.1 glutamyl-tRNA reductase [Novispirillum itersonii]
MTHRAAARLCIVGLNHRSSALSLRDALAVDDPVMPQALSEARALGLTDTILLSTCDRVELIGCGDDSAATLAAMTRFFASRAGRDETDLAGHVYALTGVDALRHLFAVAASLDSMIVGEPHVLGQVKAAHRMARDAGLLSGDLDTCVQAAFSAAKRVRHETTIAEGPVSVTSSAVQTARDLFGDLKRCTVLLAGGADIGPLTVEALQAAGVQRLMVTARRPVRAEQIARTLGGQPVPFDQVSRLIAEADVVVTSIGSRTPAVTPEAVTAALKQRRQKPILFLDVGVPGDVEPAVNRISNAFLYDLEDLERVAHQGLSRREAATSAAWGIITAEVEGFLKAQAERAAVPAIAALHRLFEAERQRILHDGHPDAEKATHLLVARLLHGPSEVLRHLAAGSAEERAQAAQAEALLLRLFQPSGAIRHRGGTAPADNEDEG